MYVDISVMVRDYTVHVYKISCNKLLGTRASILTTIFKNYFFSYINNKNILFPVASEQSKIKCTK